MHFATWKYVLMFSFNNQNSCWFSYTQYAFIHREYWEEIALCFFQLGLLGRVLCVDPSEWTAGILSECSTSEVCWVEAAGAAGSQQCCRAASGMQSKMWSQRELQPSRCYFVTCLCQVYNNKWSIQSCSVLREHLLNDIKFGACTPSCAHTSCSSQSKSGSKNAVQSRTCSCVLTPLISPIPILSSCSL